LIIRWSLGYLITDVPKKYVYVIKRHNYIVNKFLVGIPKASEKDEVYNDKTKLCVHTSYANERIYKKAWNLNDEKEEASPDTHKLIQNKEIHAGFGSPTKKIDVTLVDRNSIGKITRAGAKVVAEQDSENYGISGIESRTLSYYSDFEDSYFSDEPEEEEEEDEGDYYSSNEDGSLEEGSGSYGDSQSPGESSITPSSD
jgi:hypothetical protein